MPIAEPPFALLAANWELLMETAARTSTTSSGAEVQATADYFRAAATPEAALRWFAAARAFDVRDMLAAVQAPTLVIHRRDARTQ